MGIRKIPKTSFENYISGYYALNTPDKNGMTADWHSYYYWRTENNSNDIELFKNNFVLENDGIEYRKIIWSDEKVYIATFARAIADLLIRQNGKIKSLTNCVDDFLTDKEAEELYGYCLKIHKKIDISEFIKREFPKKYVKEKEIWNLQKYN